MHNVNRVLMFAQTRQNDIYSIKVTNEHGTYRFYRNESGPSVKSISFGEVPNSCTSKVFIQAFEVARAL